MANVLDLDDPNVVAYYGAPPAKATPGAIDLDAPAAYYGGVQYGADAKIPGAIQYDQSAKIPGAIDYGAAPAAAPAKPLSPEMGAFQTGARLSADVANAPPPPVGGPTPADDAAFERAKSQAHARARPSGGGGPVNADPFGMKAANAGIVGSIDAQHAAKEREVNASTDRIALLGEHKSRIAKMQQDDATIARLEEEEATKRFEGQMAEMQQQLADVRSKKIDPSKYMSDRGTFGLFAGVLGGVIGGAYQGLHKLAKNPFLEELHEQINTQMTADEKNIANERAAVGEQMSLLAMNRAVYKDKRLADMQTRAMYLEAAKTQLAADVAGSDSEIEKARGMQAISVIDREKAMFQRDLAKEARAQSAAASAAMYARQKERQATFKEIYKEGLDKGLSPQQSEYEALRVSAMLYAPQDLEQLGPRPSGGEYDGMTVRDRSHMKREEAVAQKESEAELAALREFKKRIPELSAGSAVGDYWSGAPGILPGVSTAKANKLSRESYNATVARAYDAAMKAAQGSAPTETQKAQLKTFYLENNDGDEDVARKINAAEEFVVQAGRAKGLHDSTPRETAKALGEKPIK